MIPKVIHYVWLGGQEKPKKLKRCMKTWKEKLPDYEFKEWNESNFNLSQSPFALEAYNAKKYAFASDYIRAKVIYDEGGIYFDTDILCVKSLNPLLNHKAFVGFENPTYPFTAVFGSEKGHPFIKRMIEYFDDKSFEFDRHDQLSTVNTKTVSDILIEEFGCVANNQYQELKGGIVVYPDTVLCNPSQDSYTIHIFTGTWMEGQENLKRSIIEFLRLRLTSVRRIKAYNWFTGHLK